jgi:hypothetical protein
VAGRQRAAILSISARPIAKAPSGNGIVSVTGFATGSATSTDGGGNRPPGSCGVSVTASQRPHCTAMPANRNAS